MVSIPKNRRFLLLVLMLVSCGGAFISSYSYFQGKNADGGLRRAVVVVEPQEHRLGVLYPRQQLNLRFHVRNTGDVDLILCDVRTTCGCSPPQVSSSCIEPASEGEIRISLTVPERPGAFAHALLFRTNDPSQPELRLMFSGIVQFPIESKPTSVYLGAITIGSDHVERELELYTPDGSPLEIKEVLPSTPWILVTEQSTRSSHRRSFRISVSGIQARSSGPFSESVQFRTGRATMPVLAIPVDGEFVTRQRVSPSRVLLPETPAGHASECKLLVQGKPLIESVSITEKSWQIIDWKIRHLTEDKSLLHVRLVVPKSAGYQRAKLHLRWQASGETQDIPVACLVTER